MQRASSKPENRPEKPVAVIVGFLLEGLRNFFPNLIRVVRHPWAFMDGTRAALPGLLRQALAFFVFSQAVQKVLWFFSMLPELPYSFAESSANLRVTLLFLDLMASGLIWHLLLRSVVRRALPLNGTMAVLLYHSGAGAVLIVPVLVFAKLAGSLTARAFGDDPVPGFLLFLVAFSVFGMLVLSRWMAAMHHIRMSISCLTMLLSDGMWLALRGFILLPFVLRPAFRLVLAVHEVLVRFLFDALF